MSEGEPKAPAARLKKQLTWSPRTVLDETWSRRRRAHRLRQQGRRCLSSVTDDDVDELRACFELGFCLEEGPTSKLDDTFPALKMYQATAGRRYGRSMSTSSSSTEDGGPLDLGDTPEMVKARLRQWAQVVGCVVRQQSANSKLKICSSPK